MVLGPNTTTRNNDSTIRSPDKILRLAPTTCKPESRSNSSGKAPSASPATHAPTTRGSTPGQDLERPRHPKHQPKLLRNHCNQWRAATAISTPHRLSRKRSPKRNIWILLVKKSWRTGQRIGTKNWNWEPSSRRGEWRFMSRAPHDHCWRSWWIFDWTIQQPVFWGRSYLGWKCHKLGFKVIFGS